MSVSLFVGSVTDCELSVSVCADSVKDPVSCLTVSVFVDSVADPVSCLCLSFCFSVC